ncbi:MAG TPA: ATP-binding protein [Chloroflexia bacterium]|jgi:signal transduction histidine kinase
MDNPTKHGFTDKHPPVKKAPGFDPWSLTPGPYRPPIKRFRLTLRQRVALLSCALILSLNVGLVLFINLTATLQVAESEAVVAQVPASKPADGQLQVSVPSPTAVPFTEYYSEPVGLAELKPIRQALVSQLQLTSAIGLVIVSILGGVGAYWLAGRTLKSIATLRQAAQVIDSSSLDKRVAIGHPDSEVGELAQAFDAMLARLERSFTQQGYFASNAAHEMRTPLTILRANLEAVKADPEATIDDYRELTPVFERTLARLERLITDLLALATREEALVYEEVSLKSLLQEVINDYTPLALGQGVTLELAGSTDAVDAIVRSDAALLSRAFGNLVENAIRYNHRDGRVVVEIENSHTSTIVSIADTGIGIPVEEQGHIFNRFYRVDRSRPRHKSGAGLGLSIVSHVVQLHGGQVQVESTPGLGSKFTVRLPA